MPYRLRAAEILAEWRAAERELEATVPNTPAAEQLHAMMAKLRDAYQLEIALAVRAHAPVPPPFPAGHGPGDPPDRP